MHYILNHFYIRMSKIQYIVLWLVGKRLFFFSVQKPCHRFKYDWYCFNVPGLHDASKTLCASDDKAVLPSFRLIRDKSADLVFCNEGELDLDWMVNVGDGNWDSIGLGWFSSFSVLLNTMVELASLGEHRGLLLCLLISF